MFNMAAENYYIERKDHSHNIYGVLGTLFVHGLLILFFYYFVLYPPNPPMETLGNGIQMNLGEENMGGPDMNPVPNPAPQEQYTPIEEQTDEAPPITSDDKESVAVEEKKTGKPIEKKIEKPIVVKKVPQLELPQKTVDTRALFKKNPNATGSGGYGKGNVPGNEGRPDGVPNGSPDGMGDGGTGDGLGGGGNGEGTDGLKINLSGRRVQELPNIEDNSRAVGKVVVTIIVNREGKVIKAVPGQVGSTTTDQNLMEKAKQGALRTKFYTKDDAAEEQRGTMTFVFRFKP